jgi:hypothetical protein
MRQLNSLLENINFKLVNGSLEHNASDLVFDSRKAVADSVFFAIVGFTNNGHQFVQQAYNQGCRIFVVQEKVELPDDATIILVPNTSEVLGLMACNYYENPSKKLKLIGINPENLSEKTISRSIDIHSPIDGYVSHVNVNIGKYVNPSDVLFELVNPTDIHLGLTIYEKDLDKIFIGQKLQAFTNHKPDLKYPCEIILIGKDLSEERSVEVHCHFEKYDKTLIPGMFMNAELEINNNNAKVLPDEAIVRFENVNYAFIATSKNTFKMIEVKLGSSEKGLTEVTMDDSFYNKNFVLNGAYNLLMQLKNKEE